MTLMTMVARLSDGLPLAATVQEDEQVLIILNSSKIPTKSRRLPHPFDSWYLPTFIQLQISCFK